VLFEDAVEVFHERADPLFGSVGESGEPIEALTEKGVCALL
jgi:hypothetical protein